MTKTELSFVKLLSSDMHPMVSVCGMCDNDYLSSGMHPMVIRFDESTMSCKPATFRFLDKGTFYDNSTCNVLFSQTSLDDKRFLHLM